MRTIAFLTREGIDATLRRILESERFRVETFEKLPENRTFSLVVVCDEFTSLPVERQPVICIVDDPTPTADISIRAFNHGAADCIRRPFSPRELVARIRNLLARTENAGEREMLDVEAMRVEVGGQARDLTAGEAEILRILLERAPAPVSIQQIEEILSPVSRHTISSRIKSLRKKLDGRLVNRVGIGYELVD